MYDSAGRCSKIDRLAPAGIHRYSLLNATPTKYCASLLIITSSWYVL